MTRRVVVLAMAAVIAGQVIAADGGVIEAAGTITDVIVYRGQALVSRAIEVELPQGNCEIAVKKLPDGLIAESIYATGTADVSIASVRYRQKEAGQDTRAEVKELEAKIEGVVKQQYQAQRDREMGEWLFKQYSAQWGLSISAANSDLNRGVLVFEPLQSLMEYLEFKAAKYHESNVKVEFRQRELEKELGELQRKLNELRAGASKIEREAVINISSGSRQKTAIKLNYIVNGANWAPQYNLRADSGKGSVAVEYSALIHQSSGEDWNNVAMSLSTAQPAIVAAPPVLEPMKVGLTAAEEERRASVSAPGQAGVREAEGPMMQTLYGDLTEQFKNVQDKRREMATRGKAAQFELNQAAVSNQMIELRADKDVVQRIKQEGRRIARTESVSVTYKLAGRLSMPSRVEQQLVGIAAFESKADFVAVGTPLLTDYVYVQADILNGSSVAMLAGPASMHRDGEFAGRGDVPLVAVGEKFTAGFGVDSQVRIVREFEDKKIDTMFGNRVETYDYRVAISNYRNSTVKLRLLERTPYAEDEKIEIRDFKTNVELSSDGEYQRAERRKGLLRWDLELKPNTSGDKATIVTYSYVMKYDKDMRIQSVGR